MRKERYSGVAATLAALSSMMLLRVPPLLPEVSAFMIVGSKPPPRRCHQHLIHPLQQCFRPNKVRATTMSTRLFMTAPDVDSSDPFRVLGLDPSPNLDKRAIKRAYRKLALKFHPDMTTTKDSSAQEKKVASERFAKINWAYATLSGKDASSSASTSSSSSTSSTSTATGGWTPPHRRKGAYASSTSSASDRGSTASTDWRDYIPNYKDDEVYDTGGDSFGAIFSDLFSGAAGAAGVAASAGGGGIFKDFIEFLENNMDGYSTTTSGSSSGNDAELDFLLQTGSLQDIGDEMDETDLVVQQLSAKVQNVKDELLTLQAELAATTRFTEKLSLEERIAELESRKKVAEKYSKKARKRLLALQTRYKQLIVDGDNDARAGGGQSRSSWDDIKDYSSSTTSRTKSTSESTSSPRRPASEDNEKWDDGFGSFGRGRGSSRRRARRRSSSTTSGGSNDYATSSSSPGSSSSSRQSSSSYSTSRPGSRGYSSSSSGSSYSSSSSSSSRYSSTTGASSRNDSSSSSSSPSSSPSRPIPSQEPYVPPHRRTSRGYETRQEEDARRLREVKVEEEFDKLKRDLGL